MFESLAAALGSQIEGITLASFGIALLGGILAGFGPCVIPMVPAIFGYVTGSLPGQMDGAGGSASVTRRSLGLVTVFVLGVATSSAGIGVLAAVLGRAIFVGAWANYLVAAICVVLGLRMLEVLHFEIPGLSSRLVRRPERRGLLGILLFGLAFGLVVPPCSTPVLAVIATLAAASGEPLTGAGLLFLYGVGRGTPLLLVAVFSGALAGLTGFSRATVVLQRVGGVALIGAAAYLVWIA
jgi:cytochrome c-type biogenesis protein